MEPVGSGFVAGGYFIVCPMNRADRPSDVLPERVISVSKHIADVGPDANWALPVGRERTSTELLGIPETRMDEVATWIVDAAAEGRACWPDVLLSPDAARTFARDLSLSRDDLLLVGIGLPGSRVAEFLAGEGGDHGSVPQTVANRAPLAAGGERLGFELLQIGYGIDHSWLCYGLEKEASDGFGLELNDYGLIDGLPEGERVATWAEHESTCEPDSPFDPWLIVRYDWD